MNDSTRPGKPDKPTPLYGLKAHANGKYYKWIKGLGLVYFGRWNDPAGADKEFGRWAASRSQGQEPTPDPSLIQLADLVDRFLTRQEQRVSDDEIGSDYFEEYRRFALEFLGVVGHRVPVESITTDQLDAYRAKLRVTCKGHATNNRLMVVRAMFRWAREEADLIRVNLYAHPSLRRIPKKQLRKESHARDRKHGSPWFRKSECRLLLTHAKEPMRTMILLALNCGMSQREIAALVWADFDLDRGLLKTIRPKTQVLRDAALWPITVEGLRKWKDARPDPADKKHADRVFLTRWGRPFAYTRTLRNEDGSIEKVVRVETITWEFRKLLKRIDEATAKTETPTKLIRLGRNFRALRRTFRTVAEGAGTNPARLNAIRRVMGHELSGNDPSYMKHMPGKRLRKISEYVFHRLFTGWSETIQNPNSS